MPKVYEMSLTRQLSLVFEQLEPELLGLSGGTLVVCLRNDVIGKFGVKHDPLECRDGVVVQLRKGMQKRHVASFRMMAIEALKHKKNWTHGEMIFDFAMKQDSLVISTWFESNYNLTALLEKENESYERQPRASRQ
ncbi:MULTISPECIES: hypothetical protein [Paenibacillus]|uniref:O-methyltransferase n=1 Tax=Paenibacillus agilis TaxID=3020863 RepID=A0A559IGI5_9BACL|nr:MULTISPECIES: hypothetical protein [Paenibacillus]TVX86766.1 O-methyltransferase [Paenibacillus agilis]